MKEKASVFWEGIEKVLALLTSVVIVVGHFFKGFGKLLVDTITGIWDILTNPVDSLMGIIHAVTHFVETGKAIWQAVSESWMRDVVNGDAKSRAEWFGYAAGEMVLAVFGTKGAGKAAKWARGSKAMPSGRRRLIDRLPAPVQKFFRKDGWRNMADFYFRGQKINWKNTLITGTTGISLLGMGFFGVPKVVKFVKKIDIDCSFAAHQSADSYLAAMLLPKVDCDFSYDKDGGSGAGTTEKKFIGKIVKNGNKAEYTNPAGNELHWFEQRSKDIENKIKSDLKSKDVGKATEAKVADYVRKIKEVKGVGKSILRSDNETAGDLDIVTKDEIIEVKRSMKSIGDDL